MKVTNSSLFAWDFLSFTLGNRPAPGKLGAGVTLVVFQSLLANPHHSFIQSLNNHSANIQ